jgi:16S rRNA (cytidine1402-2'-O)-methyltransferase
MAAAFGTRPAAIGRELTKLHEEIVRDDLPALAARGDTLVSKGEVVIGVAGASVAPAPDVGDDDDLADEIRRRRAAGASVRDVADSLARERGLSRRAVYRRALSLER